MDPDQHDEDRRPSVALVEQVDDGPPFLVLARLADALALDDRLDVVLLALDASSSELAVLGLEAGDLGAQVVLVVVVAIRERDRRVLALLGLDGGRA